MSGLYAVPARHKPTGGGRHRLREACSWDDRFAIVDAVLGRRHAAGPLVDPETAYAWRRIMTSGGLVRVDRSAGEVGWSRKRLWSPTGSPRALRRRRWRRRPASPTSPTCTGRCATSPA